MSVYGGHPNAAGCAIAANAYLSVFYRSKE